MAAFEPQNPTDFYVGQLAGRIHPGRRFEDEANARELRSMGIEDMPHVWMPPDGLTLNKIFAIPVPAAPSTNNVVGSYTTRTNWFAVFNWVALCTNYPNFPDGTGAMTWRILISGNAPSDYGNVTTQIGTQNDPRPIGPIIVRPNSMVQVQVDNLNIVGAGSYVFGVLRGWEWPQRRGGR